MGRGHLHRPRHRLQRRLLGTRRRARLPHYPHHHNNHRRTRPARRALHCETLRQRRVRQPRKDLGIPRGHAVVGRGGHARGAHGLGARRRVGAEHWPAAELHRHREPGPHGARVDEGGRQGRLDEDGARPVVDDRVAGRDDRAGGQVPRCGVAGVVEPSGQLARGELWRWQGHAMEGELEGRLGVYQRHEQLDSSAYLFLSSFSVPNANDIISFSQTAAFLELLLSILMRLCEKQGTSNDEF